MRATPGYISVQLHICSETKRYPDDDDLPLIAFTIRYLHVLGDSLQRTPVRASVSFLEGIQLVLKHP